MIKAGKLRPNCPKCGHDRVLKSGTERGKKRFQCRECSYLFTLPRPERDGWKFKALSLRLYANGVSANNIAELLNLPKEKAQYWICEFCQNDFVQSHDYEVVKINRDSLRSMLPEAVKHGDANIVVVPVDDASGNIAGMILLREVDTGCHVEGQVKKTRELAEAKGGITGKTSSYGK